MSHLHSHLFLLAVLFLSLSCTPNNNVGTTSEPSEVPAKPTKTITGVVIDTQSGKDGYTATLATSDATDYFALVSIPNVGGPENYATFRLGETITVRGDYWNAAAQNHLTVRKIINQASSEYCWLADGPVNLYSEPNTDSKNYGKFFQVETLTVLANQTNNNNEIWTRVYFRGTVKAGYEEQFADGRPMHEGIESMVGWIGGKTTSVVRCK